MESDGGDLDQRVHLQRRGRREVVVRRARTSIAHSAITIYLRAEGAATRLTEEVPVRENDLLQLAYNAAGQQFGAILSIDGRRVVTLHHPYEPALDYSYRLDDAPGFERFFFLSSDTLFSIDQVVSAAETLAGSNGGGRTGRLELPDSVDQYSVVLTKEISQ